MASLHVLFWRTGPYKRLVTNPVARDQNRVKEKKLIILYSRHAQWFVFSSNLTESESEMIFSRV